MGRDIFRRTEKQIAAGTQRVMKERENLLLQIQSEIDHDIAAGNQIQTRKRGVLDETMV